MSSKKKHRPSELVLSGDKGGQSDIMMRVISPITPLYRNKGMRDTLKMNETIRLQQNELIAGIQGRKESASESPTSYNMSSVQSSATSNWSDGHSTATSDHSEAKSRSATEKNDEQGEPLVQGTYDETKLDRQQVDADKKLESREAPTKTPNGGIENESAPDVENETTNPSVIDAELRRMTDALSRKKLKRSNVPGPLSFPTKGYTNNTNPVINSAPMRSLYSGYTLRRGPPRLVYPVVPVPHTAAQYFQSSWKRASPMYLDRQLRPHSPKGAKRRKPVLDVFQNDIAKVAPLPSQPPSAQMEHFDVGSSDCEEATEEEMVEMEAKRNKSSSTMRGNITFNEESAFNFTIFRGDESDAKKKFLEICETTWDKYMSKPV